MRRRRQKNTVLPKMIGIAVLINAILMPLLAHFGAFKTKSGNANFNVKLVDVPQQKVQKPPQRRKKQVAKAKTRSEGHKAVARAQPSRMMRPNPNAPKVVTAGGGSGPAVESGSGAAGQIPLPPPSPQPSQQAATPTVAPPPPPPAPPVAPAPQPAPPPAPAPPPHVPVIVAAQAVDTPKPDIPEDLIGAESSDFDASCWIVFDIHTDGSADPKITQSCGNSELDSLAIDTAHKWTFRPATRDGQPVESYLRLKMEFDISG